MCHGVPYKCLDFGDVWPWPLTLTAVLVIFQYF